MKKNLLLLLFTLFSFSAIHAEITSTLSDDGIKAIPISLSGNETYTQDSQIEDIDVSYTRYFSTNWQALYLPFSLKYEDWKDDFEIAYISAVRQRDINDDGKIDETILEFVKLNSGSTAPNTPYVIRAKETGEKTLSAQNTTLYKAENNSVDCSTTTTKFTFTGIYKSITTSYTLMTKQYYVLDGEKLSKASILNYPKAYQWYMTITSRNSGYGVYNSGVISGINSESTTIRIIGEEEIEVPMVVNAEYKWATFCAPFDVTIPEGVTAYTVDGVKDETERTLDMTEVKTTIPANTPVVLYSAKDVNEKFTGKPNYDDDPQEGLLFGVYAEECNFSGFPNDAVYLLSKPAGCTEVAFYPADKEPKEPEPVGGGYTTYKMQYQAFLKLSADAGIDALGLFFNAEDAVATVIKGVEVLTDGGYDAIYNAAGIPMDALQKGLNIVVKDGKSYKIYVK
ncbi:MAG: hypothetical protein J5658_01780 [Prevotella sp.]|nr:hypothetical protein [Prevotella sp.]